MILLDDHDRWVDRLGWASFESTVIVFVCLVAFGIISVRNRQHAIGIALIAMGILCCPGLPFGLVLGLAYGWTKHRAWRISTFMIFWTSLVIVAVLNCAVFAFFRFCTEQFPF